MIKKPKKTDFVITAAALQDHILRTANFQLKPLHTKPAIPTMAKYNRSSGSTRAVKLPKLDKFQFEILEEQQKGQEVALEEKQMQQYKKKLTLAQRLGLVAAPPKPMTVEEWEEIEQKSKQRDEGQCPICLEGFKNQEHIILSCSHVFHKACLDSFERFNKVKVCPICRRQDYEKKRYVHAHRAFAIQSAIKLQSYFRGYFVRVQLFEKLIAEGYKPSSLRWRRRLMFYKLSKISSRMQKSVEKRNQKIEKEVDSLNKNYEEKKEIMNQQIQQISKIKQQNVEQGVEAMEHVSDQPTSLSTEEWAKIKEKALKRCDKDCVICYQTLQDKKKGIYLLSCSHLLHSACLNAFERYSVKPFNTCPVCRSEYQKIHV